MNVLRAGLVAFLLIPAPSAWAIYCFDFTSNNPMCLMLKTQALVTMMKLQNDPRFLTYTSEGQPGTKAAKEADQVMKLAQGCLTEIDCGAAAGKAQKLVSSIPGFVKGDLGDFPSQIWYGAELPHGTLDQMFDNNQKTEELPFQRLADGGYEPPDDSKLSENANLQAQASKPMQSAALTFSPVGPSSGSDAVSLASAQPAAAASAPTAAGAARIPMASGADGASRTQASGVQYETGDGLAAGTWQSSGSGIAGGETSSVPFEMEQRVGSAISDEPEGISDADSPDASAPAPKMTRLASASAADTKKKVAAQLNDAVNAATDTSANGDAISQSDLTQMLP